MEYILVFFGSGIGGIIRLLFYKILPLENYYITLLINFIGSFLIAILFVINVDNIKFFFVTGMLAGFTTFSGFTLDAMKLMQNGSYLKGVLYMFASCLVCCLGFVLCRYLTQK